MKKLLILGALASLLTMSSCVRDEIHRVKNAYRIEYDIDDNVLYCKPKDTELMWLRFYDAETDKRTREMFAYPSGTDLNIVPGNHTIVAYSHENNSTKITYPEDLTILTAETETLSESPYRVIQAPSHVYMGTLKNIYVPYVSEEEPVYVITIPMSSPMDSWRTIVTGVKNLEYCRSITLYVTNQYEDILIGDMIREGNAVLSASGNTDSELKNIIVDFATFGMIPGNNIEMQIHLTDASGLSYRKTVDVTDQITDPENTQHIVTFEFDCTLQTMVQGGLQPKTDEWDTNYEHWTLE